MGEEVNFFFYFGTKFKVKIFFLPGGGGGVGGGEAVS